MGTKTLALPSPCQKESKREQRERQRDRKNPDRLLPSSVTINRLNSQSVSLWSAKKDLQTWPKGKVCLKAVAFSMEHIYTRRSLGTQTAHSTVQYSTWTLRMHPCQRGEADERLRAPSTDRTRPYYTMSAMQTPWHEPIWIVWGETSLGFTSTSWVSYSPDTDHWPLQWFKSGKKIEKRVKELNRIIAGSISQMREIMDDLNLCWAALCVNRPFQVLH